MFKSLISNKLYTHSNEEASIYLSMYDRHFIHSTNVYLWNKTTECDIAAGEKCEDLDILQRDYKWQRSDITSLNFWYKRNE